jgi:hypothetical protein
MLKEIDKRYFLQVSPNSQIKSQSSTDISKDCDVCGDTRGRLHLHTKSSWSDKAIVKCFNGGCPLHDEPTNMIGYLSRYHLTEFQAYKRETFDERLDDLASIGKSIRIDENEVYNTNEDYEEDSDDELLRAFYRLENEQKGIFFKEPPKLCNPIENLTDLPNEAIEYLKSRGLDPLNDWKFSPKNNRFIFDNKEVYLSEFIIIPLIYQEQWYGFQALAYKKKDFRVYLLEGNDGYKVWNYFNINPKERVYIFESIYDALSSGLDNIIAQMGANISPLRLQEFKDNDVEIVFVLDNQRIDYASYNESLKYLNQGYKVFIWDKKTPIGIKDTNDMLKLGIKKEQIKDMIQSRIFKGIEGIVQLKLLKVV